MGLPGVDTTAQWYHSKLCLLAVYSICITQKCIGYIELYCRKCGTGYKDKQMLMCWKCHVRSL